LWLPCVDIAVNKNKNMNKKVFKYEVPILTKQELILPKGSEILSLQVINDKPFIYALVNPDETEKETRMLIIVSTGQNINYDIGIQYKYIGTFNVTDTSPLGYFIGHIFEALF
jgi:hypothetical protein